MDRYPAYCVIFTVLFGGIYAPLSSTRDDRLYSNRDDSALDLYYVISARGVNGQKNLGETNAYFSPRDKGLLFYDGDRPVDPVPSNSLSLIKYSAIIDVQQDLGDVTLTCVPTNVSLAFKSPERASQFVRKMRGELRQNSLA